MSTSEQLVAFQDGHESAAWKAVSVLADALIAVGVTVWGKGDGEGGGVFQQLYEAAERAGLPVGGTYAGPR